MRFVHISDLHLGKRVNGFSMVEDQRYILEKIMGVIDDERPDAVIIAGDVYDRSVPSAEAVEMLDDFLSELAERSLRVFLISGNHDSPERLAFGGRLMEESGIHISPVYDGIVRPVTMEDEYGKIDIYMLPFVKPVHVRKAFPEKESEINSYTDAVAAAIEAMDVKDDRRNVLVTHQFVTGASRSDSEDAPLSAGGTDDVCAGVFAPFDYVALGHIHGPQSIGSDRIRYCGTPLKYSFSEASHEKSVTVVSMGAKGDLSLDTVPLVPKRDMVEIKGRYMDITARDFYEGTNYREDYVHVTLTDDEDIPEVIGKLRTVYGNLMKLDYDNARTRSGGTVTDIAGKGDEKTPAELFGELYEAQNGAAMSAEQKALLETLIEDIWEGDR